MITRLLLVGAVRVLVGMVLGIEAFPGMGNVFGVNLTVLGVPFAFGSRC